MIPRALADILDTIKSTLMCDSLIAHHASPRKPVKTIINSISSKLKGMGLLKTLRKKTSSTVSIIIITRIQMAMRPRLLLIVLIVLVIKGAFFIIGIVIIAPYLLYLIIRRLASSNIALPGRPFASISATHLSRAGAVAAVHSCISSGVR